MKLLKLTTLGMLAGLLMSGVSANAADLPDSPFYKAPPVSFSPWMIRVRALGVFTHDDGYVHEVNGTRLGTSDTVVPELDITYFFSKNIAAELILGTTKNSVWGTAGAVNNTKIGSSWLLPPTLTLQYHFTNFGPAFKPYVGAGVNYTLFFSQSAGNLAGPGGVTVIRSNLHDTVGAAFQAGFDYMIDKHWGWNFDVKYIMMSAKWDGTLAAATPVTGRVNINPLLVGTGVTYKF